MTTSTEPVDALRNRYLDLLRDSLIGLVHEDPSLAERVSGGELPFDRERRSEGKDWPSSALSMIGAKRMLQLQRAAEFVSPSSTSPTASSTNNLGSTRE